MSKKPPTDKEARLDKAVVIGGFMYNTPSLYKLRAVAEDIAKNSEFPVDEILVHLQSRFTEAVMLVKKTDNTAPIGFATSDPEK